MTLTMSAWNHERESRESQRSREECPYVDDLLSCEGLSLEGEGIGAGRTGASHTLFTKFGLHVRTSQFSRLVGSATGFVFTTPLCFYLLTD